MIALAYDCLLFQTSNGESIPFSAEMISVELTGEGIGEFDPEFLKHAASAVFHYFKHDLKRVTVTVGEFAGALEKVLRGFGLQSEADEQNGEKLEVWDDYGAPVERIDGGDKRWTWTGEWKTQTRKAPDNSDLLTHRSAVKGATAAISFEGTGAVVAGAYLTTGGMLEVYLDEKLDRKLDVYSDERGDRAGEAVWHVFGLKPGKHTVRLVVLGERYPESGGADVSVDDLIVYR